MKYLAILLLSLIITSSCKTKKDVAEETDTNKQEQTSNENENENNNSSISDGTVEMVGPPVFIYKTKEDYYHNVPVILTADKAGIESFPDITDVCTGDGDCFYPIRLEDGYLLDRKGISEHLAFVDYTYEEYAKLEKTPSATDLFDRIIDMDPLTELYFCGTKFQYKNLEVELNEYISNGDFSSFKKIK